MPKSFNYSAILLNFASNYPSGLSLEYVRVRSIVPAPTLSSW